MGRPHTIRRFPRIRSENTMLVSSVDGRALDQFGFTHTIGLGGCGFAYSEALATGAAVELMVAVRPAAIMISARVVYCNAVEEMWDVGVEFVDLGPVEREVLARLVASKAVRG